MGGNRLDIRLLKVNSTLKSQSLYLGLKGVTCTFCRAFYSENLLSLGQAVKGRRL